MRKLLVAICIMIMAVPINGYAMENSEAATERESVSKADLLISGCTLSEEEVHANETFTVNLEVKNVGEYTAKNVSVYYSDVTGALIPVETNNMLFFPKIANGVTASFEMRTAPTVGTGSYPFSIIMEYSDEYGTEYSEQRDIIVTVVGEQKIGYDNLNIPEELVAGETMDVPISIYNTGNTTLYNVTASMDCIGLIPSGCVYLGNLDVEEQGTGNMSVFVGTRAMESSKQEAYGTVTGTYTITYEDISGKEYVVTSEIQSVITEPVVEVVEEEVVEPAFQSWVSILVVFAVISIISSIMIVSGVMRKMRF